MKKILFIVAAAILTIILGSLAYLKFALPNTSEPEELKIEYTEARIERGRYLAHSVSVCMDCHSKRDWSKFSGPLVAGTLGQGGERFDQSVGMPGIFISKNITPFGIARYTDGELYRVITEGVTKEGKAMFPLMPYPYYGKMDREDIFSIIAYIRTLPAINHQVQDSQPDFPMSLILNTLPKPAQPQVRPELTDQLKYGAYMANAAGCVECHTPVDKGIIIPEKSFSGGREFLFPDGSLLRSSNITFDEQTGIGKWSEESFVKRFKAYADSSYQAPAVAAGEFNSVMPWTMYGTMKEDDLKAIYHYLKSVSPIENKVEKFVAAKN